MGIFRKTANNNAGESKDESTKGLIDVQIQMDTCQLLEYALKKLGTSLDKGEGKNEYFTTFQGERFRIFAADSYKFIEIQDIGWYEAPLQDINNMSLMRKAINTCNIQNHVNIVYTIDEDSGMMVLHSLKEAYWSAEIKQIDRYLTALFNRMFQSHHSFFKQMETLRQQEFEKKS